MAASSPRLCRVNLFALNVLLARASLTLIQQMEAKRQRRRSALKSEVATLRVDEHWIGKQRVQIVSLRVPILPFQRGVQRRRGGSAAGVEIDVVIDGKSAPRPISANQCPRIEID